MKHVFHKMAIILLGLAVIAGLTGSARADARANTWELNGLLSFTSFDNKTDLDNKSGFGLHVGYNLTKEHEVEFTWGQIKTKADFGFGPKVDVDLGQYTVGYLYNWHTSDKLTPFATVGAGSLRFSTDRFGGSTSSGWYGGGGVRFFWNKNWAVRIEGDYLREASVGATSNYQGSVGVSWIVGGKK
jgi:opacity protein-like surface antigen